MLNLVIVGQCDGGKSTMGGHLLYLLGSVDEKAIKKFEKEASEVGRASFKYAWVLDKLKAERERGISINANYWKLQSVIRSYCLIDAPGHRDYIKNMLTGTAQAEVAILVIDAGIDGFKTGFAPDGMTRTHALLLQTMGVKQLVVAINKMDDTPKAKMS